jgi:protein SCO1
MTTSGIMRWTAAALSGLIVLGVAFLEFGPELGFRHQDRAVADDPPAGTMVNVGAPIGGPFNLIDHHGRPVTDAAYRGRWMLVFFGYTNCPEDCPLTLQKMASALDALGPLADRIAPLFITVDPAHDTPDRLAGYLANFGSRIIGLTGSGDQIAAAAKAYRVYYSPVEHEQSGIDLVDHSTFLYLLNSGGTLDVLVRPTISADQLAAALRARLSS